MVACAMTECLPNQQTMQAKNNGWLSDVDIMDGRLGQ